MSHFSKRLSMLTSACLALTACTAALQPVPADPMNDQVEGCNLDALGVLVGQQIEVIDANGLPDLHRIIRPGDAVTMDYREERTNFELDENDQIVRVYCG